MFLFVFRKIWMKSNTPQLKNPFFENIYGVPISCRGIGHALSHFKTSRLTPPMDQTASSCYHQHQQRKDRSVRTWSSSFLRCQCTFHPGYRVSLISGWMAWSSSASANSTFQLRSITIIVTIFWKSSSSSFITGIFCCSVYLKTSRSIPFAFNNCHPTLLSRTTSTWLLLYGPRNSEQ